MQRDCSNSDVLHWVPVALVGLLCCFAVFVPVARAGAMEAQLDAALAQAGAKTRVGLLVEDLDNRATVYASLPDEPLKPASVMKLLTTAAALLHLGPDFAFETRLLLAGDELLVIGGGDPGLGDERIARRYGRPLHWEFDAWADALRQRGVSHIRTIALDDGIFDQELRHPDWPADQYQAWYQAPVAGLNFNDNCLDARITVRGGQVTLQLTPPLPAAFWTNALRVGERHHPIVRRDAGSDVVSFRGTVTKGGPFSPISVNRPTVFFGHALRQALEQRGVRVGGDVVRRRMTPAALAAAQPLHTVRTPLRDVLWRSNTFSQNLFAECLMKALAAHGRGGTPNGRAGSWDEGRRVMVGALGELGLSLSGAVLRDGSGLSHDNRLTARQIVDLLVRMDRHPLSTVYRESLADAGEEGTLSRRFNDPRFHGRLVAKTGTIRGVRTLAGYVTRPDGTRLAFALLANGEPPPELTRRVSEVLCGP